MEKTLMLLCPFGSSQSFLLRRFPEKDVRFMTALGGIFPWNDSHFLGMLEDFLISEEIKTLYMVQDLGSKILEEVIHKTETVQSTTHSYISNINARHTVEITGESQLSQQLSKLALFVIEDQVNQIFGQGALQRIMQENKIQIKGMLTDQSRTKSIEFHVQPELQLS